MRACEVKRGVKCESDADMRVTVVEPDAEWGEPRLLCADHAARVAEHIVRTRRWAGKPATVTIEWVGPQS